MPKSNSPTFGESTAWETLGDAAAKMSLAGLRGPDESEQTYKMRVDIQEVVKRLLDIDEEQYKMTDDWKDQLKETIIHNKNKNETTLVRKILPFLVGNHSKFILTEPWCGIVINETINLKFPPGSVPNPKSDDTFMTGIEDPEPSVVYGYSTYCFSRSDLVFILEKEDLHHIAPTLYFPFLLMEWASIHKHIEQSKIQARCGSAAILKCMRDFYRHCKSHGLKEDLMLAPRLVFSIAMDMNYAELFVHWWEDFEDFEEYHMYSVQRWFVGPQNLDDMGRMKAVLEKILQWGLGERLNGIKEVVNDMESNEH